MLKNFVSAIKLGRFCLLLQYLERGKQKQHSVAEFLVGEREAVQLQLAIRFQSGYEKRFVSQLIIFPERLQSASVWS